MKRFVLVTVFFLVAAMLGGCTVTDNRSWQDLTSSEQQQVQTALNQASQEIADALNSMSHSLRGGSSDDISSEDLATLEADADTLLKKAQQIRVRDVDNQTVQLLQSDEDRAAFVSALAIEEWVPSQIPEDAQPAGSFVLEQEDTILYGEQDNDGQLHEVATLTLYQNSDGICLEVLGISMGFTIPEETYDNLLGYLSPAA